MLQGKGNMPPRLRKKSSEVTKKEVHPVPDPQRTLPSEPVSMSGDFLQLQSVWDKEENKYVPPPTPRSEYDFEGVIPTLRKEFVPIDNLEIPWIREKGVKRCMEHLADHFGWKNYKFNLVQFWLLDVIVDCLWKAQDELDLPPELQKMVLCWVMYIINLLADSSINISKSKLFKILKEAVMVAAEVVDEGVDVPSPQKLFQLLPEKEDILSWASKTSKSSSTSSSSTSIISSSDFDTISYIEFETKNKHVVYPLPKQVCNSSSKTTSSGVISTKSSSEKDEELKKSEAEHDEEDNFVGFYQPDNRLPERFLSESGESLKTSVEVESESSKSEDENKDIEESKTVVTMENLKSVFNSDEPVVREVPGQYEIVSLSQCTSVTAESSVVELWDKDSLPEKRDSIIGEKRVSLRTPSQTRSRTPSRPSIGSKLSSASKPSMASKATSTGISIDEYVKKPEPKKPKVKNVNEKEVLKKLAEHELWKQRILDMSNPDKGWIPTDDNVANAETTEALEDESSIESEWFDLLEEHEEDIRRSDNNVKVNVGVIWAVIDFIYEYFRSSFQFTLIKLAFQSPPNVIAQRVNDLWNVPKAIKGEIELPKPPKEKVKKEKKKDKKEKKAKKEKKEKKKSSKKSSKTSSTKSSKKDKKKGGKKEKKEKPKKLTREEKAEMERLRKEAAAIEEERRKIEENRRFVFPLTDAATDELFKSIFDNWVKVDFGKEKKKGSKEKKKKKKK